MRRITLGFGLVVASVAVAAAWWRRHRRAGSAYVNRVLNPWLVEHGVADKTAGEIGLLEHVGRSSGRIHVTPVHPVAIPGGFRVIVPLGLESQWARNVIAAGHARIQVGDLVHEVDEPVLVSPIELAEIPAVAGHVMDWLGFRYLVMHEFAARAGALERAPTDVVDEPSAEQIAVEVLPEAVAV